MEEERKNGNKRKTPQNCKSPTEVYDNYKKCDWGKRKKKKSSKS